VHIRNTATLFQGFDQGLGSLFDAYKRQLRRQRLGLTNGHDNSARRRRLNDTTAQTKQDSHGTYQRSTDHSASCRPAYHDAQLKL
jgi:hypothetical protein